LLNAAVEGFGTHGDRNRNKPPPPPLPIAELTIVNLTANRITDTSALVTWDTIQQNDNKVCKIYQEGTKKLRAYTWYLQILELQNWTALENHPDRAEIMTRVYYASNEGIYNMTLNKIQCTNQSYLLTNLKPSSYYKFQMMVDKHKRDKESNVYSPAKTIAKAGSHIYYFGKQSEFFGIEPSLP